MQKSLEFSALLELIDERAAAFRSVVAAATSLDVVVPSCPEWTLLDLARHLGQGRYKWAAAVAAGPADGPPATRGPAVPEERAALLDWLATSTRMLLEALRAAGPDRGCWTWWGDSQSPETTGAAARHQLQEIAVHTYDAQLAVGAAEPLPDAIALDGVDEFQVTCCATTVAWPHEPAVVDYHAAEGYSWRLRLSGDGARVTSFPTPGTGPTVAAGPETADVSVWGTASELVLFFYGRVTMDSLKADGDRRIIDRLIAWDPSV